MKFTATVMNKSDKSLDLGLTYITAQLSNNEAEQIFDSETISNQLPTPKAHIVNLLFT